MGAERMQYCWEIMQCDDEQLCPVRKHAISNCWQWMQENEQFQCQYGLCEDCLVYLSRNDNSILSPREIDEILTSRGFYQDSIRDYGR